MRSPRLVLLTLLVSWGSGPASAEGAAGPSDWPRFRGPNGQGVAAEGARPPLAFGADKNVAWSTALPPGHSSPVVSGGRVFLTAFDNGKLETICLDAASGSILWRHAAPAETIEKVHSAHSPAAPTPATDGGRVFVYFGSYGLLAYDFEGAELWKVPVPLPQNMFGTATSPVVAGGRVVLVRDSDDMNSSVLAFDAATGTPAWTTPRPLFKASWSTPVVWPKAGAEELVVLGTGRVVAYGVADGAERWSVSGFPRCRSRRRSSATGCCSPSRAGRATPGRASRANCRSGTSC